MSLPIKTLAGDKLGVGSENIFSAIQWPCTELAGGALPCGMLAPMETLTRQELIYAAHALKVSASESEKQSKDPVYHSVSEIYRHSAESQRELAAKCERIAQQMPIALPANVTPIRGTSP